MPSDPGKALAWAAQVLGGFADQRRPQFARDRRRLLVFKVKRRAAERARSERNEFWLGRVREVKIV